MTNVGISIDAVSTSGEITAECDIVKKLHWQTACLRVCERKIPMSNFKEFPIEKHAFQTLDMCK